MVSPHTNKGQKTGDLVFETPVETGKASQFEDRVVALKQKRIVRKKSFGMNNDSRVM